MRLLLDTNIVSYFWRNDAQVVAQMQQNWDSLCISAVTAAELQYGVAKRQNQQLDAFLHLFLNEIPVLAWDEVAARQYGLLRAKMERMGKTMSVADQMIAAHALALDLTLVSSDKVFAYVPDLKCLVWR